MLKLVKDADDPTLQERNEADDAIRRIAILQALLPLIQGVQGMSIAAHNRPDLFKLHKDTLKWIAKQLNDIADKV